MHSYSGGTTKDHLEGVPFDHRIFNQPSRLSWIISNIHKHSHPTQKKKDRQTTLIWLCFKTKIDSQNEPPNRETVLLDAT